LLSRQQRLLVMFKVEHAHIDIGSSINMGARHQSATFADEVAISDRDRTRVNQT
jgi:hypothetical protein